jgi:hypothetical protein
MSADLSFTEDDDFIFGVDLSKLDVNDIVNETTVVSTSADWNGNDDSVEDKAVSSLRYSIRVDELVACSFSKLDSPATSVDYDALFEWATTRGAKLDGIACYKDEHGGRGLFSAKQFQPGDVVAVLPRSLRIGQNLAVSRLNLPMRTPDLSALSLLLLDLVLSSNDNDEFYHYAKCLPRENTLFMNEKKIEHYAEFGENYKKAIETVLSLADSCVEYIRDALSSSKDFTTSDTLLLKWGISMVQSRTHGFGTNRSRWLTPVFDFANHSPTPNCKLEGDAEGSLVLRSLDKISFQDEITIDYQVTDDAKLVATYGFSLIHPPACC